MKAEQSFFGSFELDSANACLRQGERAIFLTPKAFAMLRYLVEHPGQLVTKDDLWRAVWPGVTVTDAALTVCMSEIRKALGDEAKAPRFVQTVHRRGYRFIAPVGSRPVSGWAPNVGNQDHAVFSGPRSRAGGFVGREPELARLREWLEKALAGKRQIVFVTGEPGIGKTTLVNEFLHKVAGRASLRIGRGQCIGHYGIGEAYLPVLEALGRLCRQPHGERLIELLDRHAPTWLAQMPALLDAGELEALHRKVAGATRERMLRELAEAIEVITAEVPLVLILEDLHWSDYSTLDWLACLARREEPARLLVLGTYRPVELAVREHPLNVLKQELREHGLCEELSLTLLSEGAVVEYLAARFASLSRESLGKLARAIHRRTDGNPFFMVNIVHYLIAQELIVETGGRWRMRSDLQKAEQDIPEGLMQMIMRQAERLDFRERRLLEAASAAGAEFSVAAVAAGLEMAVAEVEGWCQALARQGQFLRTAGIGEWPDGTVAARYAFIHALYQDVLYQATAATRRIDLHRRIARREEAGYGARAVEIAAPLAVHFERARDYSAAIRYYRLAGENAARVSAHQEAIQDFLAALDLLARMLPDNAERSSQELALQLALGSALNAIKGWAAPEVERAYARAQELCKRLGEPPEGFPVLHGLWSLHYVRGELPTAYRFAEQLLCRARTAHDQTLLLFAHGALGDTSFSMGECLLARKQLETAFALYNRERPMAIGHDPGVNCLSYLALTLWTLGYPDQALGRADEALALAHTLSHPPSLAFAEGVVGYFRQYRREAAAAQKIAEHLIAFSVEHGFAHWLAQATITRGWAIAEQGHSEEGIAQIQKGLAAWRAIGVEFLRPHALCLLAEAYAQAGRPDDGLCALTEALAAADKHGIRHYEAEASRLKGELLLRQGRSSASQAHACFQHAIEIARKQNAKSLELRATLSLAHLLENQNKRAEARAMLAAVYRWFTEGFGTADLRDTAALLGRLASA
ncbi:MAG TPA: AAA family ATPase [Candidatus Binataceae bacterium]|nr:AAA family ATPase [Candidatus Binataceae bacterium]